MPETVTLNPEDYEAADENPQTVQVNPEDVESAFAGDVGPEGRRARRGGTPSKPREYTDEELGLNVPALKSIPPDPGLLIKYPGGLESQIAVGGGGDMAGGSADLHGAMPGKELPFPRTRAEAEKQEKHVDAALAAKGLQKAVRTGTSFVLSGPIARGAEGAAETLGAGPRLAEILGNATAGGAAGLIEGQTGKEVATSAATGAAVGTTMDFVAKRVAEHQAVSKFKELARKGTPEEQSALVASGMQESAQVMKRYGLSGIKNPQNANSAVKAAIARAEQFRKEAEETLSDMGEHIEDVAESALREGGNEGTSEGKGGNASKVVNEARRAYQESNRDLEILRQMEPITNRLATAHALRKSYIQQLADEPIRVGKQGLNTVVGLPIRAPLAAARMGMSAADTTLAALIQAKQNGGTITPAMVSAAIAAGISPAIVRQFTNQ